jgi:hypothetical protein
MILTAALLTTWQRCERQYALEREYRVARSRPKQLFDRLLRDAVYKLSSGIAPATAASSAQAEFLEQAARPGIEVPGDPYTIARDYCAMFETILEAVSRLTLLKLKPGPQVVAGEHEWHCAAFQDDSGLLHRWTTVDHWNDDSRWREIQGWHVFGDCAAAQQGMVLHVVEIGRQQRGHQHSAWCRAFAHPMMPTKHRFTKVDGKPLEASWPAVWYQNSSRNNGKAWVDLMEADRLQLIHHIDIREPEDRHIRQFHREVERESRGMAEAGPWQHQTMRRVSCNQPYVCPWQSVCYAQSSKVDPLAVGGYTSLAKQNIA